MTDEAFRNELWIACYKEQIDGYPLGHPARTAFQPIIPLSKSDGGIINRERILEIVYWSFTDEQKKALLDTDPDWRHGLP